MTAYDMRMSDWSSDVCSSDLHCLPFFAFTKLGKALHPFLMIGFRHIDRTQNAAPVGDLDVIARFLERGHVVQTLHALGGRDSQDANAAFFEILSSSCRDRVCNYV